MYQICCIGHITSDKIVTPQSTNFLPGGTAWYFSCALSKLDVSYLLVTSLAPAEMRYVDALRAKSIEVKVQPGSHTVFFENIYGQNHDDRRQNVLQTADSFTMEQLDDMDARIYHLGPLLADDISLDLIKTLSAKGHISLDIQGYLRKVVNQQVYSNDWPQKQQALQYVSILKADVAELQALTGCQTVEDGIKWVAYLGVQEIIITNGSKGSVIYNDGAYFNIPAYTPPHLIDATGCGDTYMAGYLYRRAKGDGIQLAGEFAAAMAGLKIAANGAFEGTEDDVMQFKADF